MRKLSDTQIIEGRWIAELGYAATIPTRTAAAMQRAGYIKDGKTSDSGPVWRFTPEGLYAWAKQAPAASTWPRISKSYIEDAEREAHLEDHRRTAARLCSDTNELVAEIEQRHPELTRDQAERLAKSGDAVSVVCMACGDSFATLDESSQHDHIRQAEELADEPAPTLNDFESVPRCAFCGQPYDECVCEYPPASVSLAKRSAPYLNDFEGDDAECDEPADDDLERKLAERRAAGGATFEQRAEIVRLAAGRNVPAELEPAVTAATATDGVLAYELAQDTISRLLRAPRTDLDFSNRVLAYRRQNGWSPRLTARQSRRLNKKMRRELAR